MGFQPMMMPMDGQNPLLMQQGAATMAAAAKAGGTLPGMMVPGMEGMTGIGMPSRLPDLGASALEGKTEEEKQRAIVVKALKEIADTEKTKEKNPKTKEDDADKKPKPEASEVDKKPPRCFLHQKPNKNCKKCQQALAASQSSTKEVAEEKPKESLDADEIMKRNTSKSSESSEKKNLQCSPMLKEQIVKSSYFKSLLDITSVDGLIPEIAQYVDTIDVYNPGSKTSPSCFICHVFRLSVLPHVENELGFLIDSRENPIARCVGFLYLRFVTPANELFDSFEEYLLDDMDLTYTQDSSEVRTTIGEYVESLLTQDKYFDTPLPRLPVKVRSVMEEKIAPMLQHRKRMAANRSAITPQNVEDTTVEVCMDGTWLRGTAKELASNVPSRVKVKVRLEGGVDVKVHLGKVVIVDSDDEQDDKGRRRKRSRSRSRGRRGGSPDWSRWKGKSDAEMLQELQERKRENAVCGHGKAFIKRPLNFEGSMASTAIPNPSPVVYEESSSANNNSRRRRRTEEEAKVEEELARRKREDENARQQRLAAVYKKYCATPSQSQGSAYKEVDRPDVLRLG